MPSCLGPRAGREDAGYGTLCGMRTHSVRHRPGGGVQQPSRRAVLGSAVAGVAAAGVSRAGLSAASPTGQAKPLPVTTDPVLHALRRLTFGVTPALLSHVRSVGVESWLDDQLSMTADVDAEL